MKRKLTSVLLALAMVVSLLSAMSGTARAAEKVPIPGLIDDSTGAAVSLDLVSNETLTLPAGRYYLTDNVEHPYRLLINSGEVWLGLAGKTITNTKTENISNYDYVIRVDAPGALNLLDSVGGGKITGCRGVGVFNTVNMYGGSIESNIGHGVYIYYAKTFNMYGGSISSNTTTYGVNISGGTFNMYGGVISRTTGTAANVYAGNMSSTNGTFNWYGGTIKTGNDAEHDSSKMTATPTIESVKKSLVAQC